MKILYACILLICLLVPVKNFAQQGNADIDSIAAKVISCLRAVYTEKILLESDKKVYGAGETVWFKSYVLNALNNRFSSKSKVLFVDLVDEKDSVIQQVYLLSGRLQTDGAIALNDTMQQGYYWLRAYTQHTISTDNNSVAIQPIYIINGKNNIPSLKTEIVSPQTGEENRHYIVSVFPEGGSLIAGTESNTIIKVMDNSGQPVTATGLVKDKSNRVVARFTTGKPGLAKFSFSPTLYGVYSIWIQYGNAYDSVMCLPKINPFAAQLSVAEHTDNFIKVRVMLEDSLYKPGYTTYIAGLSGDSLCFASVGQGIYEVNIPLSAFPAGVAQLLLFNTKKQLVSRRMVYIHNKNTVISVSPDKPFYTARQNVQLGISVTDINGKPILSALSVSVTDSRIADTVNSFYRDTLKNYTPADADMILLSQTTPAISEPGECNPSDKAAPVQTNNLFTLAGTVYNKKKQLLSGHEVVLMSNAGAIFILQDTTDANGRFSFQLPDFTDSTKFNIQVNNLKGEKEDYLVITDAPVTPRFPTPPGIKERNLEEEVSFVKEIQRKHADAIITAAGKGWLPPVTVSALKKNKNPKVAKNSAIITQEMLKKGGFNNVGDAVLRSGKFHIVQSYLMYGGPNGFVPSASDEPIVILDGLQVSIPADDLTESSPVLAYLKTLAVSEIGYIKLLTGADAGIYGLRSGHGVIEIHTTSKAINYELFTGLQVLYPKGFHMPPAFNMPDYNNTDIKFAENNPDLRTTIYWNGDIITDNNGKAAIQFFTADTPVNYTVRVTGITVNGEILYKTFTISKK